MRVFARPEPSFAFLSRLRRRPKPLLPSAFRGLGFGFATIWLIAVLRITAGDNVHEVRPAAVYRTAQMDPDRLREFLRKRGIRTVVNLRGYCPDFEWYRNECRVTHELNVAQEDVTLSAIRLPTPSEVRRLVEVLERAEYPIVLHCRQGIDRTGLAAVMVKLLEPGVPLAEAEGQLALSHGYVPFNGTENMRRFFKLYRDWLARLEIGHSPESFRQWATAEYCPGACRARLEWLEAAAPWPRETARIIRVRAENTSVQSWTLRPGTCQGVHVRYHVWREDGLTILEERAGQFDAKVAPGQAIDLPLGVPPLAPGRYGVSVELIDDNENAFSQFGVDPLVREFRVEP